MVYFLIIVSSYSSFYVCVFFAFNCVGSAWSFVLFIPATTTNDLRYSREIKRMQN